MSAIQLHLSLNHVSVLAPFLAVLLITAGLAFRSQPVLRVAAAVLAIAALVTVLVYLTGEPVEKAMESTLGTAESRIERHEETALWSLILLSALGVAAAAGLIKYRRRSIPIRMSLLVLAASLIVAGQVAWTAHLGGLIRHTELQSGAPAPPAAVDRDGDRD